MSANFCQGVYLMCYTKLMRRKKRSVFPLIIGIFSLACFVYILLKLNPSSNLKIMNYELPTLPLFFLSFFLFLFSFSTFIFKNTRRGIFLGLFVIIYFLLRLNHLAQIFFLILLIVLFIILEIVFSSRN